MSGPMTAAGSKLAISAGSPATDDAAGFAALTFTNVGLVDKLGPMGGVFEEVPFQPLDGGKITLKGPPDYGKLNPSYALDSEDAGQALMFTASESQIADYSFRVTKPDGAIRYFVGKVFGAPEDIGSANSIIMANPTISINSKPIRVEAP